MASTQMSARPLPSRVRSCTPFARTVNDASHMYQAAPDDLPLEVRQAVPDGLHHPVADREILRLPPPAGRADPVIRRARELRTPVARRPRHRELQELVGPSVVEPVDDPL